MVSPCACVEHAESGKGGFDDDGKLKTAGCSLLSPPSEKSWLPHLDDGVVYHFNSQA
jgi:hypothetical protein